MFSARWRSCVFPSTSAQVSQRTVSKLLDKPSGSDIMATSILRFNSTKLLLKGDLLRILLDFHFFLQILMTYRQEFTGVVAELTPDELR
jgi:hypothetical protein